MRSANSSRPSPSRRPHRCCLSISSSPSTSVAASRNELGSALRPTPSTAPGSWRGARTILLNSFEFVPEPGVLGADTNDRLLRPKGASGKPMTRAKLWQRTSPQTDPSFGLSSAHRSLPTRTELHRRLSVVPGQNSLSEERCPGPRNRSDLVAKPRVNSVSILRLGEMRRVTYDTPKGGRRRRHKKDVKPRKAALTPRLYPSLAIPLSLPIPLSYVRTVLASQSIRRRLHGGQSPSGSP